MPSKCSFAENIQSEVNTRGVESNREDKEHGRKGRKLHQAELGGLGAVNQSNKSIPALLKYPDMRHLMIESVSPRALSIGTLNRLTTKIHAFRDQVV